MLPKRLHLIFGNDSVCEIELLQTDLVKIWYNAFSKNKNFKLFTRNHNPTLHSNVVRNSYPEAIDIINNAIERVEYLTNTEWNVRAFDGMQFDITHKIFWYSLSILFVVGIWFLEVKLFKIKSIPFYSDIISVYKKSLFNKKWK